MLILFALLCGVLAQPTPTTFPTISQWVVLKQGGIAMGDVISDGANSNGRNYVGNSTYPTFYFYNDGARFFIRMRLDHDPTNNPGGSGQILSPYSWGLLIDTDGVFDKYDYCVMITSATGALTAIALMHNTIAAVPLGTPNDDPEVVLYQMPICFATTTACTAANPQTAQLSVACAGTTCFSGSTDYFLDYWMNVTEMYKVMSGSQLINFIGAIGSSLKFDIDLGGVAGISNSNPCPASGNCLQASASDLTTLNNGITPTGSLSKSRTRSRSRSRSRRSSSRTRSRTKLLYSRTRSRTRGTRVFGDPHFVGLYGQKYKVNGPAGFFYNLYTSPNYQVNALWYISDGPNKFTVNCEMGIRIGGDRVYVSRNSRVRLNGDPISQVGERINFQDAHSYLERSESSWTIVTEEFTLELIPRMYEIDIPKFKLDVQGNNGIHGLLGQSWNISKWPQSAFTTEIVNQIELFQILEGAISDYVVVDGLFGVDFTFNKFNADAYGYSETVAPPFSEYWKLPYVGTFEEALAELEKDNVDFLSV